MPVPDAVAPSGIPVPLSVLDLAPLVSGATPGEALRNCVDLARQTERFGYQRAGRRRS